MEFDWLDAPFDLRKVPPKEIEESFEDPFSIRLMLEDADNSDRNRYFNLGKTVADRGLFEELPIDRILEDFRTVYGIGDAAAVRDEAFH